MVSEMDHSQIMLKNILNDVQSALQKGRVCVVFDLDSTLFCVSPRTQAILREFALVEAVAERFPDEAQILKDIEVRPSDWGIRSVLERYGVKSTIDFFETLRGYWRERFFSNSHMRHDTIYPHANLFVQKIDETGADVVYLTGRSRHLMEAGTIENLKKWSFPLKSEDRLYMKPKNVDSDVQFKVRELEQITKSYDALWFFENEPLIINEVIGRFPAIHVVFVDSVHSGKATVPKDLPTVGMTYLIDEV